jgi:hypothetical protein
MERQLTAFVERPSRQTYLAVREAVLRAAPLPLATTDLVDLEHLLEAGSPQQALDRLDALPASKVLSPRVHLLAAEAAEAVGDAENGEVERFLFVLCLQGLLATGDGSSADPYLVCHATDEYDILEALDLEPAGQSLVEEGGRLCDVLTCTNGREVWFDASPLVARPERRRKPAKRKRGARRRAVASRARR